MGSLHERNISLWIATTPETTYPPLSGEVTVDIAVIGYHGERFRDRRSTIWGLKRALGGSAQRFDM